jgi:hypothetical protein
LSKLCFQCEEEISPKRLTALPNTTLCIKCQEKDDLPVPREHVTDMRRMAYVAAGQMGGSNAATFNVGTKHLNKQPCEEVISTRRTQISN